MLKVLIFLRMSGLCCNFVVSKVGIRPKSIVSVTFFFIYVFLYKNGGSVLVRPPNLFYCSRWLFNVPLQVDCTHRHTLNDGTLSNLAPCPRLNFRRAN